MIEQIVINMDNALVIEATSILDEIGLNFQTAVTIFAKRLVRERNLSFLLTESKMAAVPKMDSIADPNIRIGAKTNLYKKEKGDYKNEKGDLTKSRAILLFRNEGVKFNNNITFASKNRGAYSYWANPEIAFVDQDWYLILNDWEKRELHLFFVPAHSIHHSQLTTRNDRRHLIDLQIMYNDHTFNDNRSGLSFAKFLIKQINY